ncbi:NAD(P)-dependent alcohol dehydrogenase [Leifsonia sp. 22587]|uniref:NAD(P)-dependent alcohol dehydrogenase n=1 Tax=Leifsonia sp. 22587 TaxID=3453946 RepID=UPI003F84BED0
MNETTKQQQMRAVTQDAYGPPSVLTVESIPVPVPGEGEVLVRVRAAGIDAGTWHLTTGRPYMMRAIGFGWSGPKARVRGLGFSGVVEAVGGTASGSGSAAPGWRPGDAVFGSAEGALAEFVVATAEELVAIPEGTGFEEAAALPVSGVTALQAVNRAGIQEGDAVLVLGAAGGVGHFAVQLAAARGAKVTGVCSGPKAPLVRELGAVDVLDYTTTDVLTLGRIYDVIIDTAGNRPLSALRRILASTGSVVLVGGESGGPLLGGIQRTLGAALLDRFARQHLVGLVARDRAEDLRELAALVADGTLRPVIDTAYPLERTAEAVDHVGTGHARGKIVVTP